MAIVTYASNFEDVLLLRLFGARANGFYVDIGADHPVYWSTTKVFYDRGWSGTNIEPGPHFPLLLDHRPRDININAVVLDASGEVDFFVHEGLLGTSTVLLDVDRGLQNYDLRRRKIRVQAITLTELARDHPRVNAAQFIKIDAEGVEDAIIRGADWTVLRPEVLLIEATKPYTSQRCDQWRVEALRQYGYLEAYFDGVNAWFVREESADLLEHFTIPVNQLDGFTLFDPQKEEEIAALKRHISRYENGMTGHLIRLARRARRLFRAN
jgi:FkbM family methyltransferase